MVYFICSRDSSVPLSFRAKSISWSIPNLYCGFKLHCADADHMTGVWGRSAVGSASVLQAQDKLGCGDKTNNRREFGDLGN